MSDFLLELASEEIPARMQAAAAEQLRARFVDGCKAAGLAHGDVIADVTPRRLWLIARDVAAGSAGSAEEVKGPRADAPPAAIEGFLKKTGLAREQLETRATPKGDVLFAVLHSAGRPASAILAALVPRIVAEFQWPKSMRWGAASASTASPRWVRPLTGIVALLDGDVVECEAFGLASSRRTRGHRIHAPQPLRLESAATYADQLRGAHVLVASAERRAVIEQGAAAVAAAQGLAVIADPGLVAENAGLTEWPVPMLGRFDSAFLSVPREVIQLTMRTNQKYFALAERAGGLAPAFICVANLEASDGGAAIIKGNERVLSARLSDARFFWDQDVAAVQAGGLAALLPKLGSIVFHEKLGTVADKVDRVAKLARWLVESGAIPADGDAERAALADLAEQAARLCKADLVSATVAEFPEVQGIAGAYLARVAGLDARIADAIRDHYKPVGQGDDVPTAPVSVAVALAERIDALVGFFHICEAPTGSKDPFALRRSALGFVKTVTNSEARFSMNELFAVSWGLVESQTFNQPGEYLDRQEASEEVLSFFADRLKVQQREAGVRHDLIDAVFALGGEDDLVRLLARVRALQAFIATEDGTNLLAGYKRAANILRIETAKDGLEALPTPDPSREREGRSGAEVALGAALDAALPAAASAVESEDFTAAMTALASLRAPVDAFFADVMVNDPDPLVRRERLALLARFRDACHSVADFSRIEG